MKSGLFEVDTLFVDDERTIALVRLQGVGRRVVNEVSNNTYRVVSGLGQFLIEGREPLEVAAGDVVGISRGTAYQDEGDLVMLVTSVPPFNPEAVQVLD
jgi:mannose-6-phosphate isomerase-like protein (cupin superfamily)